MSTRITIKCPHCKARAIARSSREKSDTMREIWFACTDIECGHTYAAALEVIRTLSPSAKPRAGLALPMSPHVKQAVMEQMQLC